MTQIVIDIPASLSTLVPTLPALPEWTARQVNDFVVESMFVWLAVWAVVFVILLIITVARPAARLPVPPTPRQPPRVKSQTFINWLVHGGVNGVQR